MNEEKKFLNLSNDELIDVLSGCCAIVPKEEQENICLKCPYVGMDYCISHLLSDAAGRISNLSKQIDILTRMMKLEDE